MKQLFSVIMTAIILSACHSGTDKAAAEEAAKQKTIDSLSAVVAKQRVVDSMNLVKAKNEKVITHVVEKNTMTNSSSQPANVASEEPAKKKGLSHTAKGAIVGAGTGAVTGAIINSKNRGEGAVIGTIIGAGVGAGTGLIVDNSVKKKKKKAAQAAKTNQ